METKKLLKNLKRRLGLITTALAMLLVSQGMWAATYPAGQTIYVKVPSSWVVNGKISMYVWGGTQSSGNWCGQDMTWVEDSGSDKVYKYTWSGTFTGFKITTNSCNTQANNSKDGSVSQTSVNSCIVANSTSYSWTTYTPPKMYTITFVDKNDWGSCYYYIPNNSTNCNWNTNGFSPKNNLKRFGEMTKSGDTYTVNLSASDMNGKCITFAKYDQKDYDNFWQNEAVHCDNFDPEKETTCTSKTTYTETNSTKYYEYAWGTPCTDPAKGDFTVADNSKTYNGNPQTATVSGKTGMGDLTVKYGGSASQTNVGEYAITVEVAAGDTYCATTSAITLDDTFEITKADQSALTFNGSTQCVDTEVTLSATGGSSGETITYKKKSGEGTVSGTTLTTSTAGDVEVTATCPGGDNYNDVTADATFTFVAKPTAYAVSGTATICTGNSTNVTLANSQTGYTYKLYKGGSATSTTKAGTGSALDFSVSAAGTYTIKGYVTGNESCTTDMTGSAVITVNQNMALTSISLSSASECIGGTSTISTSGLNVGGGSISYTSSNSSVASVSGTTITAKSAGTVTITGTVSGGCGSSVSKTESFTVKASNAISSISFTKSPLKVGETCTATAEYTTVGGTGSWSADGTYATITDGGIVDGKAKGTVTGKAIGTATITYTITGGCGTSPLSKDASLEIITNCESPTAGSIGGTTSICAGNGTTLTLSGQTAGTNLQWYKSTDGSSYSVVTGATGIELSTGTLNANAYYKVRVSRTDDASCYSETTPVTVTVTQIPSITAQGGERCGNGEVTLQATASPADKCTVNWYDAATGGTKQGTGLGKEVNVTVGNPVTLYAEAVTSDAAACKSTSRDAATATAKLVPSIASVTKTADACGDGNITFTATGATASSSIEWFENSVSVGTGGSKTFSNVPAGTSHSVTAKATLNGCESAETSPVTGTRKANPSLTIEVTSSAITAGETNKTYGWEAATFTATSSTDGATVTGGITQTTWETAGKDGIINGNTAKGHVGDAFTGSYTATGTNGCTTSDSKTVTVIKAEEVCNN